MRLAEFASKTLLSLMTTRRSIRPRHTTSRLTAPHRFPQTMRSPPRLNRTFRLFPIKTAHTGCLMSYDGLLILSNETNVKSITQRSFKFWNPRETPRIYMYRYVFILLLIVQAKYLHTIFPFANIKIHMFNNIFNLVHARIQA